ncbi:MAG: hypothetical protein ITG02_15535, partial [Patulibacter sp.]|nr:hypothetical protein [Patulibacter sp.]
MRTLLPVIWLMALLVAPAVAYLAGERQPNLENRAKTPFPDLNRGTLRQEHTFQQIDAALRERLPLRRYAIDAEGRIAINLFGDSPSADVLLGEDGWLYYRPELRICTDEGRPKAPPEDAAALLTRTITASGRTPVVIVAGSKMVTHQEHLSGVDASQLACVSAAESRVHERLDDVPGGYTIQDQLDALEADGKPTFLRSDTHWNFLGREAFARTVLDAVRPGLASEARLRGIDERERSGDLGVFIGQTRVDRDRQLTVTGSPETDFAPGEVLFVGDSQLDAALRTPGADGATVLDRVFPGQPVCNWTQMYQDGCAGPLLAAQTVVIESVARNLDLLVDTCWRPVSLLASTVQGDPARWAGGGPATRLELSPTAAPAHVEADDDRTDVPRLVRIPIDTLPTDPNADPAKPPLITAIPPQERPCALAAVADQSALVIPVMAGERVSDVELDVAGPAG